MNLDTLSDLEKRTISEMVYFHECGHATIACLLGVTVIKIDMEFDTDLLPGAHINATEFNRLSTDQKLDFFMGGYAAEKVYTEMVSKNPSHFANKVVNKLFNEYSQNNILLDVNNCKELLHFSHFANDKIEESKQRASKLIMTQIRCVAHLFKELAEAQGRLEGQQVRSIFKRCVSG